MRPNATERRRCERETIAVPFIYSLDEGSTLAEGEWREAVTIDIGPVFDGGLAFETKENLRVGQEVRVALFMDVKLKEIWEREEGGFPIIYQAKVMRVNRHGNLNRVALIFGGLVGDSTAS